ncbi:MAG: metalloregulator ArsR/SmtB family transcription factor [Gemmatimonadota bacterium]
MKAGPDLDTVFQALSDPTRRDILEMLREGERNTGDLARAFPVSRPAVSRHLRVLCDADLVVRRKVGRRQLYRVAPEPLVAAHDWLTDYARHWQGNLARLKALVEGEWGDADEGRTDRG